MDLRVKTVQDLRDGTPGKTFAEDDAEQRAADGLAGVIAQLRHANMQLAAGAVKDQKQFADGLIAPQIRKLEKLAHG